MDSLCSHSSCALSSFRGLSRGFTYGSKIRFTHSVVMAILFGKGTLAKRCRTIVKNAWRHGKLLGIYVFLYKSLQCLCTRLLRQKLPINSLVAGAIAGNFAFSKETSINSQITLYLLSRVATGSTTLLYREKKLGEPSFLKKYHFEILTTLSWAFVMFLFETDKTVLQKSLKQSMVYLYDESDVWESWLDFIPFGDTFKKLGF